MVLAFDLDGCIANFNLAYGSLITEVLQDDKFPPGWKTDPTHPRVWNWEAQAGYAPADIKEVWDRYILGPNTSFWKSLEPLPGAVITLRRLNNLSKVHDIYFITHRMGFHAKQQTEAWLYEHGINYPTVILSGDKVPILKAIGAEMFIDDKPDTINNCVLDQELRSKCVIFVQDTPYNQEGVRKEAQRVPSVKAALDITLRGVAHV